MFSAAMVPVSRSVADLAGGILLRLQADRRRRLSSTPSTDRQLPFGHVGKCLDLPSGSPQSPPISIVLIGTVETPRARHSLTRPFCSALRASTCSFGSSDVRTDRPPS